MATDDASSADMRRSASAPDADPLALDEETVERLLAGDLPPDQAPPGYAEVAALLAAASGAARPSELAGEAAALAELRAVTRARLRPARARRAERRSSRRRVRLAVVVVTGALATGGAAAAASGHLPGPVREAARSILVTVGAAQPTTPTPPSTVPGGTGAGGASRPELSGSTGAGPGPAGSGPVAGPGRKGLCEAYLASRDHNGKNMDATAFRLLAEAAGGAGKIPAYCQDTRPAKTKPKADQQQTPPDDPGQGQGQGGPGAGTGGGDQGQGGPPSTQSPRLTRWL
jgi:hypothetical protein